MPQNQNSSSPPTDSQNQSKQAFEGLQVESPVDLRQSVPLQSEERKVTFEVPKKSEEYNSN